MTDPDADEDGIITFEGEDVTGDDWVAAVAMKNEVLRVALEFRGKQAALTCSASKVLCNCSPYKRTGMCKHAQIVISNGVDAPFFQYMMQNGPDTQRIFVPLLTQDDTTLACQVELQRKQNASGLQYQQVVLLLEPQAMAVTIAGEYVAIGERFVPLGIITAYEGREAIRAMISAWSATQINLINVERLNVCNGFACDGKEVKATIGNQTSILLTGCCLDCWNNEKNPFDTSDDVPEF